MTKNLEKWIEDCREKTLILKFRAKDYILKSKQEQITQDTCGESDIAKKTQKPKKITEKISAQLL